MFNSVNRSMNINKENEYFFMEIISVVLISPNLTLLTIRKHRTFSSITSTHNIPNSNNEHGGKPYSKSKANISLHNDRQY